MGKKIVRITENNLVKMISNIVYEQYGEDALASALQKVLTFKKPEDTQVSGIEAQSGDTQSQNTEPKDKDGSPSSSSESEYKDKVVTLLSSYEGFRSKAYRDGKGYSIGYGSSIVDGKPVKKGDTITKQKAIQQKFSDIDKFKNRITQQIGGQTWNDLDLDTKVVLTSIAYNYGSLPSKLVNAAKNKNKSQMHNIIKNDLSQHNKGINRWRREDEAAILATGESKREPNYNV